MLIRDMIHSCSNDEAEQAAVACIGGLYAERVRAAARERGVTVGCLVVVRYYATRADREAMATLRSATSDRLIGEK